MYSACVHKAAVRLLSPHQELGRLPSVGELPTNGIYEAVDLLTGSGEFAHYVTSLLNFGGLLVQQGKAFDADGMLTFMVWAPLVQPTQADSDAVVGEFVDKCPDSMLRRGR